jgi:hypothetical protein
MECITSVLMNKRKKMKKLKREMIIIVLLIR